MATKTGNWMMALGAFIVFAGLCFLPAAFGRDADRTMFGAGFVVMSSGLLLISIGFYAKAQALGTASATTAAPATTKRARGKSICDRCAQEEPVIQCRVHQLHLCGSCLSEHYDFRSCAYIPSTRRGATAKSNAAAYSQSSSG